MKKKYLNLLYLFIFPFCLFSQQKDLKNIKVIYKLKIFENSIEQQDLKYDTQKVISEVDKNIAEIEYALYCNISTSIYFIVEKLKIKESFSYKLASRLGGRGIYYKNISDSTRLINRTTYGQEFNILYPLNIDNWKITSETKVINNYLCYKATSVRKDFDPIRNIETIFYPEVWFTPEIPIPFGPKGLDGLPGLVLEGTINGKTIIYASKIDFNCQDCINIIKKPKKGKDILKEDYLKLIVEKTSKS